jgi:hypothetical protein
MYGSGTSSGTTVSNLLEYLNGLPTQVCGSTACPHGPSLRVPPWSARPSVGALCRVSWLPPEGRRMGRARLGEPGRQFVRLPKGRRGRDPGARRGAAR